MDQWSKEWMKYINIGEGGNQLIPFPIQMANCDRLENTDAVYIFDEVGSGKTISSGLMALHYLYNRYHKNGYHGVLVITTNSVKKAGQFEKDWFSMLPFGMLGYSGCVGIRNNHHSNLYSKTDKSMVCRYGLVIIDEAHKFLHTDTDRYWYLTHYIRAEKVVFLTATPVARDKDDLHTYADIADAITEKRLPRDWIGELSTYGKEPDQLVCSRFDLASPVTRYFKDTIKALKEKSTPKRKAIRTPAELWYYPGTGSREEQEARKREALLRHLHEILKKEPDARDKPGAGQGPDSRCIIFTRYKAEDREAGAYRLARYLTGRENEDESPGPWKIADSDLLCDVVTADNREKLSDYQQQDPQRLPHVLLVTAGIAEEGLNLPGYNYVINYHIPSSVASLEQRFGRVDRLESAHDHIHACYLLSESGYDVNTFNFRSAAISYLNELLTRLPSRNTIISEQVTGELERSQKHAEALCLRMMKLAGEEQLQALASGSTEGCDPDLLDYLGWKDSFWDEHTVEDTQKRITYLREMIKKLSWAGTRKIPEESLAVYRKVASELSDGGFYTYHEVSPDETGDKKFEAMRPLDPVKDCAAAIRGGAGGRGGVGYSDYQKALNAGQLALPNLLKEHPTLLDELEQYYEGLFSKGATERILSCGSEMNIKKEDVIQHAFPFARYPRIHDLGVWPDFHKLKEELHAAPKETALAGLSPGECDLLNQNVLVIKRKLPFSYLCDEIASRYDKFEGSFSPAFSQRITPEAGENIYFRMTCFSGLSGDGAQFKNLLKLIRIGITPEETWVWDKWSRLLDAIHRYYCSPQ